MSKFRKLAESILYNNFLFESEQKVNWILSQPKLIQNLEKRIQNDDATPDNITPEQLLKEFDKSKLIGKFLPWVIERYSQGDFDYTDLNLINNYLEDFTKNSNKLEKKDINQYKSLAELNTALKDVRDIKGSNELKRDAKSGAEKIYEDSKWIILIPHTKEAAMKYGKHTKWCTAAINDNMFDYYNKYGPLYILINKQHPSEKYQFHFETDQYNDVVNHGIDLKEFLKENPKIKHFFKNIRPINKSDYRNWIWFDDNELDYDNCLKAVKKDSIALKRVPDAIRDYNMCLEAVKQNGHAIQWAPEKFKDYKLCLEAIKKDGYALKYIPDEIIDYNMCLEVVKQDYYNLRYVPDEFKDYKLCLEVIKNHPLSLNHLPNEIIDYNFCFEAVKQDSRVLSYVPKKFIDYDLCLEAVKQNGYNLIVVPKKFRDYNMCLTAVKQEGRALGDVPNEFKDYDLCLDAVKQDGYALRYVPENLRGKIKSELNIQ